MILASVLALVYQWYVIRGVVLALWLAQAKNRVGVT